MYLTFLSQRAHYTKCRYLFQLPTHSTRREIRHRAFIRFTIVVYDTRYTSKAIPTYMRISLYRLMKLAIPFSWFIQPRYKILPLNELCSRVNLLWVSFCIKGSDFSAMVLFSPRFPSTLAPSHRHLSLCASLE